MKLLALIDLVLVLAALSKGTNAKDGWIIKAPTRINVFPGEDVTVNCSFKCPPKECSSNFQVYWKRNVRRDFKDDSDKDVNEYIYHPNVSLVAEEYRGKTTLIGNKTEGNCSLQIRDVAKKEEIYLRLITATDAFGFWLKKTLISVSAAGGVDVNGDQGSTGIPPSFSPAQINTTTNQRTPQMYAAVFSPLCLLLVIVVVVTAVLCRFKHTRSQALTREESGYYANFSRASTDPAVREAPCKKQDDEKIPQPKIIDDPIYANTQGLTVAAPEDDLHNVYANVARL